MTYLSPLHATLILFADFVFDPKKASTQGWIAFGIAVAIWLTIIVLYYLISVKLFKEETSSKFFVYRTLSLYIVLYLVSTAFVIYYLVKYQKRRDIFITLMQLGILGGMNKK